MNLLLLTPSDLIDADLAVITDYRLKHLQNVLSAQVGDIFRVGMLNGLIGSGSVTSITQESATLKLNLSKEPPSKLPVTLLLALPRPKMLRRILQSSSSMGVSQIILLNSQRVEKSFWQSPLLQKQVIYDQLVLGLEQAQDTELPIVLQEKLFKPFVEDKLPKITHNSLGLIAHPGNWPECPRAINKKTTLAIGPEGGWTPYEVEKLMEAGLSPVQIGTRILRVETAITAILARLF